MRFDYEKILMKRNYFEQRTYGKVAQLEQAKINNRVREKRIAEKDELEALLAAVDDYQSDIKRVKAAVETEDRQFKNRRIGYVNTLVTEALEIIFPCEQYRAKLHCDFYRTNEATLVLLDRDENEMIPDICSGKLQQYLISFAAVSGIVKGLGVQNLYVDEAFGVAAPAILGEIGEIVQKQVESGIQVVMIAQNPGVYQELPRREITLQKNPVSDKVIIKSTIDF